MSWSFLGDTFLGLHIIVINTGGQKFLHAKEFSWSQWLLRRTVDDTSWPTENLNLIQNREWSSFLIRFLNSTLITLHLMISMFNNVASVLQGREGIIIISSFLWIPSFYIQFLQFFSFRSTQSDKKKSSLSFHYICTTLSTARGSKDAIFSSTSKFNVRGH